MLFLLLYFCFLCEMGFHKAGIHLDWHLFWVYVCCQFWMPRCPGSSMLENNLVTYIIYLSIESIEVYAISESLKNTKEEIEEEFIYNTENIWQWDTLREIKKKIDINRVEKKEKCWKQLILRWQPEYIITGKGWKMSEIVISTLF